MSCTKAAACLQADTGWCVSPTPLPSQGNHGAAEFFISMRSIGSRATILLQLTTHLLEEMECWLASKGRRIQCFELYPESTTPVTVVRQRLGCIRLSTGRCAVALGQLPCALQDSGLEGIVSCLCLCGNG